MKICRVGRNRQKALQALTICRRKRRSICALSNARAARRSAWSPPARSATRPCCFRSFRRKLLVLRKKARRKSPRRRKARRQNDRGRELGVKNFSILRRAYDRTQG